MSIWSRITDALAALASGEGLSAVLDRLRTPPERSVAFTIAVIALGAKMAKADGQVTRDEVAAFRQIFAIPPGEEANAARVFNLARQDVAGFDAYARKIKRMFRDDDQILTDLAEGLFHIAVADGHYHPDEDAFLSEVARIFGLSDRCFRALRARFVGDAPRDPYDVLGVGHDAPLTEIRSAWKRAVRDCHPDRMVARGVPEEAVKLAERRLIDINRAWEEISAKQAA
ncbi:molecular chaperone DjiA [Cereibacter azotoformans]|uniref:DnaJ like chaperone protein n=1 Tax=Cereibacter azotoformans TaxID=43057 RepID=A0A2T5KEX4_9RHOB|nr:molecular chaperone DjiA [Cereibacter azotoformans]AXQ92654.1 molecular chaperone DjiA [Cereibacter sphaeroides]MBO4169761.1 molecular chaperone DjiA [Cereibacter azotoformans]PTR20979.1 DnaJ like chaperone protein [Cereibacter azotoformans]UIJ30933.1 molecular chaperone DjiA [Cereibacter azotoformans]